MRKRKGEGEDGRKGEGGGRKEEGGGDGRREDGGGRGR